MKITRKVKRDRQAGLNVFSDTLKLLNHRFPDFFNRLSNISDPRHQSYIKYDQKTIIMERLLASCCHSKSMREMTNEFNNYNVIKNFAIFLDEPLDELPHGDTVNNYLREVDVDQFRNLLTYMTKELINKKVFDDYKIFNEYYQVIIDATQLHSYSIEHTPGSLVTHHANGDVTYHNNVLLALMSVGNTVIPMDFEWLENSQIEYDKQDCELSAAKRLLKRLKQTYKRLKICISADSLYFCEPVIEICEENKWKYIFTYKERVIGSVDEYYEVAKKYNDVTVISEDNKKSNKTYEYYNRIEYRGYRINIVKMQLQENCGERRQKRFANVTNFKVSDKNHKKIIEEGRKRWKIENKGFNDLKNQGYNIKHAYSYNENAMKGHFVIQVIAQLIMQLVEHYEKTKKVFESIRKLGSQMKEALRTQTLSAEKLEEIQRPFQIRKEISY